MNKPVYRLMLILILLGAGLALPAAGSATMINLTYSGTGLMNEDMAYLPAGSIVYILSVGVDGSIDPPNPLNGMAGGDDVWLGGTTISDNVGSFSASIDVEKDTVVYIRFFNDSVMGEVTYYGVSGLYTVSDPFNIGIDFWDVTPAGSYFWTEYPWHVVPEPETWLMFLPALLGGAWYGLRRRRGDRGKVEVAP